MKSESDLTHNDDQLALLESAKDKLRMATIERKRMSSINAERGTRMRSKNFYSGQFKSIQNPTHFKANQVTLVNHKV